MKKTIPIVAAAALMASVQVNAADMQKQQQPMNGAGGNTTEAPAGTAPAPTGAAPAQSGDGSFGGSGAAQEAPADQVLKPTTAEELKGEDVYNAEGDKVASVKEIVKEAGGKSDHAVLTVGGIFGIGGTDVRVPLDEIYVSQRGDLEVAMTEEELEKYPPEVPDNY